MKFRDIYKWTLSNKEYNNWIADCWMGTKMNWSFDKDAKNSYVGLKYDNWRNLMHKSKYIETLPILTAFQTTWCFNRLWISKFQSWQIDIYR